ncbi:GGDEF domain-containing protein [Marinobacterium sp. D7]|uniref:GGDEF domain-containing protein n=1 Tax=Marinobacterium ramblicola TaxID=2849041 RepID=UPI001C2D7155|nr:GGDEF domain-containing protein [Marinobacterium ramblicola]
MAEQDDWKQKYKELAQECEVLQQQVDAAQTLNRTLSNQLALGVRGQSAALDVELDQLRDLVQKSAGGSQFDKALARVERQIKLLDDQRLSVSGDIRNAFERWLGQLRGLSQSEAFANLLKSAARRVPDASEHLYKLSSLLLEMVELQKGLLPRSTEEQSFALNHGNQEDSLDLELLESQVAEEMLKLIEALNVQSSGVALARQLIERIESGLKIAEIGEVMVDLVKLARLSAGLEHQEFENYLLNLNEQLAYVQNFLSHSQDEERLAFEAHQHFDREVRQNVSKLHQSVKSSNDLPSLKQAVSQQLNSIVQSMDQYRLRESEREKRMQVRYESLLEKVEQMEAETSRVRSRMEEEQLRARTDPLTGLPNRVAYDDQLKDTMGRWERYQTPFSVAVIDLDRFKEINDAYGHLAGDKVLRLVARVLQRNLRSSDFIARYGGEEFVVIFPSTVDADARAAAEKLRDAVAKSPFNFHGEPVTVTASIGVAEVSNGDDDDKVFARADSALYKAKEQGRNKVVSA